MDFLSFIAEDVTRWILGRGAGPGAERACQAWVEARYVSRLGAALDASRDARHGGRTLWERLSAGEGSPEGDLWVAASLPRVEARGGRIGGRLGADVSFQALLSRWERVRRQWPSPEAEILEGDTLGIGRRLGGLPAELAYWVGVGLGGLGEPLDILPPSLRRDARLVGEMHRRALSVAAHLGGLGDPLVGMAGGAAEALRDLLAAHRRFDLAAEGVALARALALLGGDGGEDGEGAGEGDGDDRGDVARALRLHTLALSLKVGDGDGAAGVISALGAASIAAGRLEEAFHLEALRADVADSVEIQREALGRGADLALRLGTPEEAVVLLRRQASLWESAGDLKGAGLAWLSLARIFVETGRPEEGALAGAEAVERLGAAAARGPLAEALALRGEAGIGMGRSEQGLRDLRQALALTDDQALAARVRERLGAG